MPISQAALEERLRKMSENARTISETSRAVRDAAAQPEAVATPQPVNLVQSPLSPLSKK